jgi:tetratricopeptide (TPR) repeat protein
LSAVSQSPEKLYELAKLYSDRTDYRSALDHLKLAGSEYIKAKRYDGYLECVNLSLRIYAELEEFEMVEKIKTDLQDLILKESFELSSKTYYTLALCSSYKGQSKTALEYLEKSLSLALAGDDKKDICYAINGLAAVYTELGRYEDALKEIYNLEVFFQVMELPDIKLSSQMINAHILYRQKKYEQALDVLWLAYETLKTEKNIYMYVSLLYAMGLVYSGMGDKNMARMYLNLAKKTIDVDNLIHLSKSIDEALERVGGSAEDKYDIVFNSQSGSVFERKKGKVDFKNQFILLDMLKMFMQNPGEVYSKEDLVNRVWKQEYDPSVHDNKIYVTIKRLRKMIEPDYDKPKYIFRAKNGYYLNKGARILLES